MRLLVTVGAAFAAAATFAAVSVPTSAAAAFPEPVREPIPADAPVPTTAPTPAVSSLTVNVDGSGTVTGVARDFLGNTVPGEEVSVTVGDSNVDVETDSAGAYQATVELGTERELVAVATADVTTVATVDPSPTMNLTAHASRVASEAVSTVSIRTVDENGQPIPDAPVSVLVKEPVGAAHTVRAVTDAAGTATVQARVWRNPQVTVTATSAARRATVSTTASTVPVFRPVAAPSSAPQPRQAYPLTSQPVGRGAHAVTTAIPGATFRSMRGLSWRPGCLSPAALRVLTVNYRGFDGYRHRGQIVVNAAISHRMAVLFSRWYNIGFPIRQMRLVDAYGRNTSGRPGANDYKSMAADNTSGFNCRYVVGKEARRVRSPHASGRSIDVNPWENPYVSPTGVYPNSYWLNSRSGQGVFSRSGPAVRAANSAGCRWGGAYADYHHFDC